MKGDTSGIVTPAGYIGEIKETLSSGAATLTTNTYSDGGNAGVTVGPGTWMFTETAIITIGTMTSLQRIIVGVGTSPQTSGVGDNGFYMEYRPASHTPTGNLAYTITTRAVLVTTTTTYYPKVYVTATVGTATCSNFIYAVRIA
jgi:hypothetical protein